MKVKITSDQPEGVLVVRVDDRFADALKKIAKNDCKADGAVTREKIGIQDVIPGCDVAIYTNDVRAMKECLISHGVEFS